MGVADRLVAGLGALEREDLRRTRRVLDSPQGRHVQVGGRTLLNFASNDYLGLANHPRLREAMRASLDAHGAGSGASPLVTGHMRIHEDAEARFAAFCGLPRALLFGSGYAANIGILGALAGPDAEVFGDRLNHACLHDGARLSRATYTRYPHLDLDQLERDLARSKAAVRVVATDVVFSMDGDVAPLREMLALCERHDAWLVLDDAHGIGVLGPRGRGALAHFDVASARIVYMATLGKALGGYGAFACGADEAVEWLVQKSRTYIYSTALPPMMAAGVLAALDILEGEESPVARLHARIAEFRAASAAARVAVVDSATAIQPVIVGSAARALEISARLLEHGLLVPAIRPPTVPEATSRLRVSLSAAHERADVERLALAMAQCLGQ